MLWGSDRSSRRCASSHCAPRVQRAASGEGGSTGHWVLALSSSSPASPSCRLDKLDASLAHSLATRSLCTSKGMEASVVCFLCAADFFLFFFKLFASRVPLSLNDDYILTEVHSFTSHIVCRNGALTESQLQGITELADRIPRFSD